MFVDFTVTNFRSFSDPVIFEMTANAAALKAGFAVETNNPQAGNLFRVATIFGANASGKSNFVRALLVMQKIIKNSNKINSREKLPFEPNKLVTSTERTTTAFQISFLFDEDYFEYGFEYDDQHVYRESLVLREGGQGRRRREVFFRERNADGQYDWEFNNSLIPGSKDRWKNETSNNELFLALGSKAQIQILDKVFNWLTYHLRFTQRPSNLDLGYTIGRVIENKEKILRLIGDLDIKIKDLNVEEFEFELSEEDVAFLGKNIPEGLSRNQKRKHLTTQHSSDEGRQVEFSIFDESDGTQAIAALSGPVINVLEEGYCWVIDELHNSLHPHALRELVRMFQSPEINTKGAQLIFTGHEPLVVTPDLMHKDQVWFTERVDGRQTTIYSLRDFTDVRDVARFSKFYLGGKYGAVPRIDGF